MDIQKLIIWAEAEREKALADCMKIQYDLNNEASLIPRRIFSAFSHIITGAELLLSNKPTEAITGSAHSANTLLGERAASENDQSIGGGGAEHSETAIVGQNEQTEKVCLNSGCWFHNNDECQHFVEHARRCVLRQTDGCARQEP